MIERTVDEDLARALLAEQHPDLADRALTWVGTGWDNAMWRLGDDPMSRFPVRGGPAHLCRHRKRRAPRRPPRRARAALAARPRTPAARRRPGPRPGGRTRTPVPMALERRPVVRRDD